MCGVAVVIVGIAGARRGVVARVEVAVAATFAAPATALRAAPLSRSGEADEAEDTYEPEHGEEHFHAADSYRFFRQLRG
jgi:hypothetical protein